MAIPQVKHVVDVPIDQYTDTCLPKVDTDNVVCTSTSSCPDHSGSTQEDGVRNPDVVAKHQLSDQLSSKPLTDARLCLVTYDGVDASRRPGLWPI